MAAFSGLWNGVFGENYSGIATPQPPISGVLRVLLQKRGLYGYVREFGRNAPDTVKGVEADRDDLEVRGGWTYATRTDDVANQVTITNIGEAVVDLEDRTMPPDATAAEALSVADTLKRVGHPADSANLGVTSPAVTTVRET